MQMKALKGNPLVIEPGIVIDTLNPSWNRKFKVTERIEREKFIFFRCEWTEPNPEKSYNPDWNFVGFGVAHVKGTPIITTWIISTSGGKPCDDGPIEQLGMRRLERNICDGCKAYVIFKHKSRRMGPECIQITNTCPKCGHRETDVLD